MTTEHRIRFVDKKLSRREQFTIWTMQVRFAFMGLFRTICWKYVPASKVVAEVCRPDDPNYENAYPAYPLDSLPFDTSQEDETTQGQ